MYPGSAKKGGGLDRQMYDPPAIGTCRSDVLKVTLQVGGQLSCVNRQFSKIGLLFAYVPT